MIPTSHDTSHIFESVTVTVFKPAGRATAVCVVSPLDHKNVNGGVPPTGLTIAEPSLNPKQVTSDKLVVPQNNSGGSNKSNVHVVVQPLASVISAKYAPGGKLLIVGVVNKLLHKIVKGAVPPLMATESEPLDSPKQSTGCSSLIIHVSSVMLPTVKSSHIISHPTASVIVAE